MYRISHYIAILLLLLFTRVMVPDALILELHAHTHTVHAEHTDTHKAHVGQKHTHCPVEDLFDASFQGTAVHLEVLQPSYSSVYKITSPSTPHNKQPAHFLQRGPPVV
ncbi:hypothetical protein [Pontibacter burrus]|uniref:DUF2946 domain-containing protein n=1 Tax=Pontibacter burrus TaxID=2704466 RepID=A0A6B3LSP3_9BACT|nr:hypothetical protein [Pontibacter burrus]NEM96541.1 hypothetical protein [Pontibacter burrus]